MTAPAVLDRWKSAFEARRRDDEPAWLKARRGAALERFRERGFPTRRDEAWRYTDLSPIVRTAWTLAGEPNEALRARARREVDDLATEPGPKVVLLNGRLVPELSDLDGLPAGLFVGTLSERADDLEDAFDGATDEAESAFAALNAALFPDALIVDVEAGAEIATPLHLVALCLGDEEATAAHPRVFVRVGAQARSALRVTWRGSTPAPFLSNTVAEVVVGDGGRLDWLDVQQLPPQTYHVLRLVADVGRDALLGATCLHFGADLVRTDLEATLVREGAACRLDGVSLLGRNQHVDIRTNLDHAVPHGTSDQLFKSILDDRASAAFTGRVLVRPGAQKTNARQANHSLLLSRQAVADSVPQLEIFADDVKCAHGATVGQMDEDALFYLRSRGIGPDEARSMLVRAFAGDVADRVEHEDLAARAHAILDLALGERED